MIVTEREAIQQLAQMVAGIASRCWEAIGTDGARSIQTRCIEIMEAMDNDETEPS